VFYKRIGWEGIDWINLIEDSEKWLAAVNMLMTVFPNYLRSCRLSKKDSSLRS
jgi:hypothetical protein